MVDEDVVDRNVVKEVKVGEDNRFHYLYKITNLVNNKIYIGVHSTKDLNDGYFGSSGILDKAIAKYGRENFIIEILEYFNNKEEKYLKEAQVVTTEFVKCSNNYNAKAGGYGGWGVGEYAGRLGKHISEEHKKQLSILKKGVPLSAEHRKKMSIARTGRTSPMKGKFHTEEGKAKIGKALSGSNNYLYGKKLSRELVEKMVAARVGKYRGVNNKLYGRELPEEVKVKISRTLTGKKQSVETCKKKSLVAEDRSINCVIKRAKKMMFDFFSN